MSTPRSDFFAREAGDYLRELEPLVGSESPPGETLVRLARALRGAAMLAGPHTFTAAASEVERIAKRVRDGTLGWEEVAPSLRHAVGELGRLVGEAGTWDDQRDRQATSLAEDLRGAAGPTTPVPGPRPGAEESMRAFVARETAAVASALELAARAMAEAPSPPTERLGAVTRAMQSLRGMAGLTELAPLADLLDATDLAVRDLQQHPALPPRASDLFFATAGALSRLARDITERGRTAADLPEAERVADMLFDLLAGPEAVVPVATLLADVGDAVLAYGGRRDGPAAATAVDLASLGERLRQGAAQIGGAPSTAAARLQGAVLLHALREAPGGLGTEPAGDFLRGLIATLESGPALADPARLAALLERAGTRLTSGARGNLQDLRRDLDTLAGEFAPVAEPAPGGPAAKDTDVVPIEELLLEEEPVPIEWLAPDPVTVPADRTRLERSLSVYSRLIRTEAPAPPLDALLVKGPAAAAALPPDTDIVPIENLLYRGRAALMRADEVRRELETTYLAAATQLDRVEPLVRELLDLVPLALDDDR